MRIFAGLGNPGARYAANRHNIGFMAVDAIARAHGFSPWSKRFSAEISEGRLGTEKVLLLKPQSFMNLSGQPVGEAMRYFKGEPADLVVFHDELDLEPARVRVKTGGGHGGHNGLKSIDAHCGKDYVRVRLGIGHPGDKSRVNAHVLGDFAKADHDWLDPLIDAVAEAAPLLLEAEPSRFMNEIARRVGPPVAKADAKATTTKPQSHIRQARRNTVTPLQPTGPMADMLKKLFGKGEQ